MFKIPTLRGRGSRGHAQRLRGSVRDGARSVGARPAQWPSVLIHESASHALEGAGVGWQRLMGVRQALGERPVSLARDPERGQRDDAPRGVGDAAERAGSGASAAAARLVPALTVSAKIVLA